VTFFQWLVGAGKSGEAPDRLAPPQTVVPDNGQAARPDGPGHLAVAPRVSQPFAPGAKYRLKKVPAGPPNRDAQMLSLVRPVPRPMAADGKAGPKNQPLSLSPSQSMQKSGPARLPPDPATLPPAEARGIHQDDSGAARPAPAIASLPPVANPDAHLRVPANPSQSLAKPQEPGALSETPTAAADAPASPIKAVPPPSPASLAPEVLARLIDSGRRLTSLDFPIEIGQLIPDDVNLAVIPPEIAAQRPELGGRLYIVIGQKAVVADPRTRRILHIFGPAS
jgi:hypothetical protein